jgi:hypothetical protein
VLLKATGSYALLPLLSSSRCHSGLFLLHLLYLAALLQPAVSFLFLRLLRLPPASGLVCLRGRAPHVTSCVQVAPGEMDLGLALQLLRLPLDLGEHPTLGGPVELKLGKFGPYVEHANQAASLPKVSRAHCPIEEWREIAAFRK